MVCGQTGWVRREAGTVDDDLARLRDSLTADRQVNLVGPLGSGKSTLLAALRPAVLVDMTVPRAPDRLRAALAERAALVAVDAIDSAAALRRVRSILSTHWCPAATRLVLASRSAVSGRCAWDAAPPATVTMTPWPDSRIDALAARRALGDPDGRRFVTRLAGGNPLVASCLIAAAHKGAPSPAATDHAADVITTRLATERPGTNWRRLLRVLAAAGFGDQELLDVDDAEFTSVAGLSIVTRARLGLTVEEPYRTILDLSYRWRRPLEHRTTLSVAGVHRIRMLSETSDHELRKDITMHGLFLSDEPHVRAMLFPPRPARPPVTVATDEDVDDIARLIHLWATDNELDRPATERLVNEWLQGSPRNFHVTRDDDGRPTALAHLVPFADAAAGGVEPVAQQFTGHFLTEPDGTFVITGYWPDEASGAAMLHRIIEEGTDRGRMVVCTPTPEYQRLARAMGLTHHGTARDDTFGTGHTIHVFGQRMTPGDLPKWLARLTRHHRPPDYLTEELARALASLRARERLTRSPLLAAPHTATPAALRDWLTKQIEDQPHNHLDHTGLSALTDRFRAEGTAALHPPPGPAGATTLDEYIRRLRALRAWAGNPSYAEIAQRIERLRATRGQPPNEQRTSKITVYDCFRTGRRRLDIDLVTDIVHALGGGQEGEWRQEYGSITMPT